MRPAPTTRRTRIVCISDTHNSTVKLPKGDVLIHAGDLTNQGSYSEVRFSPQTWKVVPVRHYLRLCFNMFLQLAKAVQWLEKADFEAKIVVAGNQIFPVDAQSPDIR